MIITDEHNGDPMLTRTQIMKAELGGSCRDDETIIDPVMEMAESPYSLSLYR